MFFKFWLKKGECTGTWVACADNVVKAMIRIWAQGFEILDWEIL